MDELLGQFVGLSESSDARCCCRNDNACAESRARHCPIGATRLLCQGGLISLLFCIFLALIHVFSSCSFDLLAQLQDFWHSVVEFQHESEFLHIDDYEARQTVTVSFADSVVAFLLPFACCAKSLRAILASETAIFWNRCSNPQGRISANKRSNCKRQQHSRRSLLVSRCRCNRANSTKQRRSTNSFAALAIRARALPARPFARTAALARSFALCFGAAFHGVARVRCVAFLRFSVIREFLVGVCFFAYFIFSRRLCFVETCVRNCLSAFRAEPCLHFVLKTNISTKNCPLFTGKIVTKRTLSAIAMRKRSRSCTKARRGKPNHGITQCTTSHLKARQNNLDLKRAQIIQNRGMQLAR